MQCSCAILSSVACPPLQYFSTFSHKRYDFRKKKVIDHKRCFLNKLHGYTVHQQYVVWQKSNETDFLLIMNFILFTNQGYPLQNSSLGQLHSDGGVVYIVRSSAGRLLLEYLSARRLRSSGYYPKYQNG